MYALVMVLDAGGAELPARMTVDRGRVVLAIDDARARYPVVVDPLMTAEEATLVAPDGAANLEARFAATHDRPSPA